MRRLAILLVARDRARRTGGVGREAGLPADPGRRRRRESPRHRGPRPVPVAGGRVVVRGQGVGQGPERLHPRPARRAGRARLAGQAAARGVLRRRRRRAAAGRVPAVLPPPQGRPGEGRPLLAGRRRRASTTSSSIPMPCRRTQPTSLGEWVPSYDGKTLAYALQVNNADEATLYVKDVATGKDQRADRIEGAKYASPSWTPGRRRVLLHVAAHRPVHPRGGTARPGRDPLPRPRHRPGQRPRHPAGDATTPRSSSAPTCPATGTGSSPTW